MSGFEITDKDVAGMVRWLKVYHPDDANPEFARGMLVSMKLGYRRIGWNDPDKIEDYYSEYVSKAHQKDNTSDE